MGVLLVIQTIQALWKCDEKWNGKKGKLVAAPISSWSFAFALFWYETSRCSCLRVLQMNTTSWTQWGEGGNCCILLSSRRPGNCLSGSLTPRCDQLARVQVSGTEAAACHLLSHPDNKPLMGCYLTHTSARDVCQDARVIAHLWRVAGTQPVWLPGQTPTQTRLDSGDLSKFEHLLFG